MESFDLIRSPMDPMAFFSFVLFRSCLLVLSVVFPETNETRLEGLLLFPSLGKDPGEEPGALLFKTRLAQIAT